MEREGELFGFVGGSGVVVVEVGCGRRDAGTEENETRGM